MPYDLILGDTARYFSKCKPTILHTRPRLQNAFCHGQTCTYFSLNGGLLQSTNTVRFENAKRLHTQAGWQDSYSHLTKVQQLKLFTQLYPHNARPVQPVNDRAVREAQ